MKALNYFKKQFFSKKNNLKVLHSLIFLNLLLKLYFLRAFRLYKNEGFCFDFNYF